MSLLTRRIFCAAVTKRACRGDSSPRVNLTVTRLEDRLVPSFAGGVSVAAGDVNGDGFADIVTGAGTGGHAHIRAFSGATGAELASFLAYGSGFAGGAQVALGDVTGDGVLDIVTGAEAGAGGHVKVFAGGTFREVRSFFAFEAGFAGGVAVSTGDVTGDGRADLVVGTRAADARVKVFDGVSATEVRSAVAYAGFKGGVSVASADLNGDGFAEVMR